MDSEEREIFIYMNQIQNLDKELERCQHECDDLVKEDRDLDSWYRMLEVDKKDITECLKFSLPASETNINKLTEWLESQQQGAEQDREALKLRHSQVAQELQERIDELQGRLGELDSACMMQVAKSEEQKRQLRQQRPEYLDKEMEDNAASTLGSLMTESKLEEQKMGKEEAHVIELTTSDIVQKERDQLSEHAEQFHHLLRESCKMLVLEGTVQEQLQNANKRQKDDKKTAGKKRDHAAQWRENNLNRYQLVEAKTKHYRTTQKHKLAMEENLRRDLASESEECHHNTAKASQLEADHQRERSKRRELEGAMWEGVTILRQNVTGSKNASDTHSKKQRLKEVLEILKAQLTSAEIPDLPTDASFLLIRYRVGDLSFVPRPTWKCKPAVSTRTKLLPTSRKTSSSASPSPPAL